MSVIWSIIVLLILCFIVWITLSKIVPETESFVVEPTDVLGLRNFFHYQMSPVENPPAIPVVLSPGVGDILSNYSTKVDDAVETTGFPKQIGSLFKLFYNTEDPLLEADEKCRILGNPRALQSSRTSRSDIEIGEDRGCAWWFVEDPTVPSVAAYGYGPGKPAQKSVGPVAISKLPRGGRWIWDIAEATQKEEIKRCKSVTTCSLLSGVDGCGFCPAKGYAVPVDTNGTVKYSTNDEGNCPTENIILRTSECPTLTYKAQDYRGDFDYDLNGNAIRNERYDSLTNPAIVQIQDPCELEGGRLKKECRLRIAKEIGRCEEGKGLHRIIENEGNLTETDRIALFYLQKYGDIELPAAMWEPLHSVVSPITKTDAEERVARLYTRATSGPPSRGRAAALWFINETPFNVCDFGDDDLEVFPLQCIQREFRKQGCQASGSAYPTNEDPFRGMTYGQIRTQFRDLYQQMLDTSVKKNVREQDEAVQKCLGIEIQRKADETFERNPNMCREQGIEYWFVTFPTVGQTRIYNRRILTDVGSLELFKESGARGKELADILNSRRGSRGYIARTYSDLADKGSTVTLVVPKNLGRFYSLWVNQERVSAITGTEQTTYKSSLPPYRRSEIEVRFEGSADTLSFGDPELSFSPAIPMYLAQSSWKPFIALAAEKDNFRDENDFLQLKQVGPIEVFGNAFGAPIRGMAIQTLPSYGLWMSVIKTITARFFVTSVGAQVVFWRLDQGNGGERDTTATLHVVDRRFVFTLRSGTYVFEMRATELLNTMNQWIHVAVVLGSPLSTNTRIYINGRNRTPTNTLNNGILNIENTQFSRLVLGGVGLEGAVGRFHVYEKVLDEVAILRDMNFDATP